MLPQGTMNDPNAMEQNIQGNQAKGGDSPQAQAIQALMKQSINPQQPTGPNAINPAQQQQQPPGGALSGMMARYGG